MVKLDFSLASDINGSDLFPKQLFCEVPHVSSEFTSRDSVLLWYTVLIKCHGEENFLSLSLSWKCVNCFHHQGIFTPWTLERWLSNNLFIAYTITLTLLFQPYFLVSIISSILLRRCSGILTDFQSFLGIFFHLVLVRTRDLLRLRYRYDDYYAER